MISYFIFQWTTYLKELPRFASAKVEVIIGKCMSVSVFVCLVINLDCCMRVNLCNFHFSSSGLRDDGFQPVVNGRKSSNPQNLNPAPPPPPAPSSDLVPQAEDFEKELQKRLKVKEKLNVWQKSIQHVQMAILCCLGYSED